MEQKPWYGVMVATALPWKDDDTPDFDAFGRHITWLAGNGCQGATPNGSLGEYQQLSPQQRYTVVQTALDAAPQGFSIMPGVADYGALGARRHAEQAAEAGCPAVMLLPPNTYRASRAEVIEHYRLVAQVGIPIVAYNNPFDTKVDLVPNLLAELYERGYIVGVKEFTGDVRRFWELAELAPGLDVLVGCDDVALEIAVAGSPGWISGYPNAFPRACVELWQAATAHDLDRALPLYRQLHPLLRWDAKTEFVQAIKLSMDLVPDGIPGGRCLPPRGPLPKEMADVVTAATERALAAGLG